MNNYIIILLIIIAIVALDKGITYASIKSVEKNFPEVKDPITIEKNPLARWFFYKFGLIGGTILYGIVSVFTVALTLYILYIPLSWVWPETALTIAVWLIIVIYFLAIGNNVAFFLKFNKVIP